MGNCVMDVFVCNSQGDFFAQGGGKSCVVVRCCEIVSVLLIGKGEKQMLNQPSSACECSSVVSCLMN